MPSGDSALIGDNIAPPSYLNLLQYGAWLSLHFQGVPQIHVLSRHTRARVHQGNQIHVMMYGAMVEVLSWDERYLNILHRGAWPRKVVFYFFQATLVERQHK